MNRYDYRLDNETLHQQIAEQIGALHRSAYRFHHITIHVSKGVVTLRGHVRSFYDQQVARETARRVKGVREICNALEIRRDYGTIRVLRKPLEEWDRFFHGSTRAAFT